jgi:hypothetical protein
MSKAAIRILTFLFALVFVVSLVTVDLLASAQDPAAENQNSATAQNSNMNMSGTVRHGRRRHRRPTASQDLSATEQPDLSGTYSGVFDCSDAGLVGDTTLTITGNQFTTADGKSGRITAATTRGYTAVAMQVGEFVMPAPGQTATSVPIIVSMRARKSGDRLILSPVPSAMHRCTFTPGGGMARRHGRRRAVSTAAGEPAAAAQPAEATAPAETAAPSTPRRRRGKRSRANVNANMETNTNTNSSMNENENTGAETPNMNASPTPTPPR